jgi:hypothetical protein
LEAEHTGSPRLVRIVGKILQLPALQRESRLFRMRLTEQSEAELVLARRDVILGRSDSAWHRVRQLQSLDKRLRSVPPTEPGSGGDRVPGSRVG